MTTDPTGTCRCGKYAVSPEHCLTLFDRTDAVVACHAVGACWDAALSPSVPPASRCDHDWLQRGSDGDWWRECYLCGAQEDEQ